MYADLGTYKESVYCHEDELPIEFSFEFNQTYFNFFKAIIASPNNIKKYVSVSAPPATSVAYTITKDLVNHESTSIIFKNKEIGILRVKAIKSSKGQGLLSKRTCIVNYEDLATNKFYIFNDVEYDKDGFMTLLVGRSLRDSITSYLKSTQNDDESILDYLWHRIAFLVITQNYLNFLTGKIQYINPIDTHPTRVFLTQDKQNNDSINDLTDVVEFFTNQDEKSKSIQEEYINILKSFGIADDINIIYDERLPVRELRVKIRDVTSNIYDVGYGVALQLPIILKALLAERLNFLKHSIILIEQPEVHLHPKLHSQLITILLSLSKSTTYFIETHSEHIVRKLQVDIKHGKYDIKPEDVTIHYLKKATSETEVTEHKVEKSGKLTPGFPDGFFDNSFNLVKELLD